MVPWGGLEPPSPADEAGVLILDDRGMVWKAGFEPARSRTTDPSSPRGCQLRHIHMAIRLGGVDQARNSRDAPSGDLLERIHSRIGPRERPHLVVWYTLRILDATWPLAPRLGAARISKFLHLDLSHGCLSLVVEHASVLSVELHPSTLFVLRSVSYGSPMPRVSQRTISQRVTRRSTWTYLNLSGGSRTLVSDSYPLWDSNPH